MHELVVSVIVSSGGSVGDNQGLAIEYKITHVCSLAGRKSVRSVHSHFLEEVMV